MFEQADTTTIKGELVALMQRDQLLQAEAVVEWAREHPQSHLYAAIEWDDVKASAEYRIWQARRLIAIHVVRDDGVRQILSLSIDRIKDGGGYRDIEQIMSSEVMRDVMLRDALAELDRVKLKYETLSELARVWGEIDKAKSGRRSVARRSVVKTTKPAKRSRLSVA